MTKEKAIEAGYVKIIDFERTKDFLVNNMAIINHATGELKDSENVFNFKSVLVANFAFLARIILYHIFLVSLALQPGMVIFLLLTVELAYMLLITNNFFKLKYLVSLHLFIGKVTQSFFLLIFHLISLIIYFKHGPNSVV